MLGTCLALILSGCNSINLAGNSSAITNKQQVQASVQKLRTDLKLNTARSAGTYDCLAGDPTLPEHPGQCECVTFVVCFFGVERETDSRWALNEAGRFDEVIDGQSWVSRRGFVADPEPHRGDLMVIHPYAYETGANGHVGVVEEVTGEGSVLTIKMLSANWNAGKPTNDPEFNYESCNDITLSTLQIANPYYDVSFWTLPVPD
jgi:hypothetical protein